MNRWQISLKRLFVSVTCFAAALGIWGLLTANGPVIAMGLLAIGGLIGTGVGALCQRTILGGVFGTSCALALIIWVLLNARW